jgi:hypothetical protein
MAAHLKARPEPRIPSFGNVNATLKTPCFHNYGKPSLDLRRAPKVTVTRERVSLCQKGVTLWLLFMVN